MEQRDQLVSNVWKSCSGLEVIPLELNKVFLHVIACLWEMIGNYLDPFDETNVSKALLHQHEEGFAIAMFILEDSCDNPCFESGSMKTTNLLVWSMLGQAQCVWCSPPVDGKGNLDAIMLLQTLLNHLIGMQLTSSESICYTSQSQTGLHLDDITHDRHERV